jgi:hypothetical protein
MPPFKPETLQKIRRMRKARRLWRIQPMFAFYEMTKTYPDYTYEQFVEDLRRRTPKKKKKFKSSLHRYGRYQQITALLLRYRQTNDPLYALQAIRLRRIINRPYRMRARIEGITKEYTYSALIPFNAMEEFAQKIKQCQSWAAFEILDQSFRERSNLL